MSVLMMPKDMIEWGAQVSNKTIKREDAASIAPKPRVGRRVYLLAAARKLSKVERVRLWEMVSNAERVLGISETDALELIYEVGSALNIALSRQEMKLRR